VSDFPSFSLLVMTPSAANADGPYHLFLRRDSIILMLRVRQKSVAGHEYARLNIGASITRENSENGALPIREGEQARKQRKQKPPRGETWRLFHELINSTRPLGQLLQRVSYGHCGKKFAAKPSTIKSKGSLAAFCRASSPSWITTGS
jgi:hypothetical protein